jgi:hypothetical protein
MDLGFMNEVGMAALCVCPVVNIRDMMDCTSVWIPET